MLPPNATSNRQRIDSIIMQMDGAISSAEFRIQNVFSSHLVILASGHVEISVREIINRYVSQKSNLKINKFITHTIERENSLNCEKIGRVLDKFDMNWRIELAQIVLTSERESINSLNTLRDQIAHGKQNSTGYITVKEYFKDSCKYLLKLNTIVV